MKGLDTGNANVNNVIDSFIKVGGIGALQAATKETCRLVLTTTSSGRSTSAASRGQSRERGRSISLDRRRASTPRPAGGGFLVRVQRTAKDTFTWGLAAGMYTGVSTGIRTARGKEKADDWKNAVAAGAITGAAISLVQPNASQNFVFNVISGGALAAAAQVVRQFC